MTDSQAPPGDAGGFCLSVIVTDGMDWQTGSSSSSGFLQNGEKEVDKHSSNKSNDVEMLDKHYSSKPNDVEMLDKPAHSHEAPLQNRTSKQPAKPRRRPIHIARPHAFRASHSHPHYRIQALKAAARTTESTSKAKLRPKPDELRMDSLNRRLAQMSVAQAVKDDDSKQEKTLRRSEYVRVWMEYSRRARATRKVEKLSAILEELEM